MPNPASGLVDLTYKPNVIHGKLDRHEYQIGGKLMIVEIEEVIERSGTESDWHEISSIQRMRKQKRLTETAYEVLKRILRM
ncbi:MAG: hypothetical protein SF162_10285 [bacterium]|nr:hypothetical protein [bacterium]